MNTVGVTPKPASEGFPVSTLIPPALANFEIALPKRSAIPLFNSGATARVAR